MNFYWILAFLTYWTTIEIFAEVRQPAPPPKVTVQFPFREVTASEFQKVVDVPIERLGDVNTYFSVRCTTESQTAKAGQDYEERPNTDQSAIVFIPGEKTKSCGVLLLDDTVHEATETFLVHLITTYEAAPVSNSTVLVRIINDEDVTTVQFQQSAYSVPEPSAADHVAATVIGILRLGDINGESRLRIQTGDGTGTSGLDYHPKNKMVTFVPNERVQFVEIDVLHNPERHWHKTFTVSLSPDGLVNAELGAVTVATITILEAGSQDGVILPTPPVVVSLSFYENVSSGLGAGSASPGHPLVCVTPCDPHFPSYATTRQLCDSMGIDAALLRFSWEVAASTAAIQVPINLNSSNVVFNQLVHRSLFAPVDGMVLDSTHFRPGFLVRCVALPLTTSGGLGLPVWSQPTRIDGRASVCHAASPSLGSRPPLGFQSQPFVATLKYLGANDQVHANRLHIHVEIPHQDGMLPLVSTHPLVNVEQLLADPVYRKQHTCSNLVLPDERDGLLGDGFLKSLNEPQQHSFNDSRLQGNNTLVLYRHLNPKKCLWVFDAWYHMAELVELCGGHVVSDSLVCVCSILSHGVNSGQMTVRVPLYVSYVFASVHQGWTSLEHHTSMEFSFVYNAVLGYGGIETGGSPRASVHVQRIAIGESGKMMLDFQTRAIFRGYFVMHHPRLSGHHSRIIPPSHLLLSFNLTLLWTAETYDGPTQRWRAVSDYSLKDYSGKYTLELVPCTVAVNQKFTKTKHAKDEPPSCTPHLAERFEIPIAFQQTNRPVPIAYSLDTNFQLLSDKYTFLSFPNASMDNVVYEGVFTEGQKVFGRVFWNPNQDLESAYKLHIEQVYICTGHDGYTPIYDPTGEEYEEGPTFGCLRPSKKLRHRIVLLDRSSMPHLPNGERNFEAKFAEEVPEYSLLEDIPGIDGFVFSVDALYNIEAGQQWFVQAVYTIRPATASALRTRREVQNTNFKNGTNICHLWLTDSTYGQPLSNKSTYWMPLPFALSLSVFCIMVLVALILRTTTSRHWLSGAHSYHSLCLRAQDRDVQVVILGHNSRCTVKVKAAAVDHGCRKARHSSVDIGTEV